jgi:hypothetical protein
MFVDSRALIQDTISRLEALVEILSDEAVQTPAPQGLSQEERTRKEIGLSIRVLLPKLRSFHGIEDIQEPPRTRGCVNCED